jgi:hypothetical protein
MWWVRQEAHVGDKRNAYISSKNLTAEDHWDIRETSVSMREWRHMPSQPRWTFNFAGETMLTHVVTQPSPLTANTKHSEIHRSVFSASSCSSECGSYSSFSCSNSDAAFYCSVIWLIAVPDKENRTPLCRSLYVSPFARVSLCLMQSKWSQRTISIIINFLIFKGCLTN